MKTSAKKEKPIVKEEILQTATKVVEEQDATNENFSYSTESLMPELEELVKKNPNRLIGCGG